MGYVSYVKGEEEKVKEDKVLTCCECHNEFVFTASEQEFYEEKGFTNEPRRCPSCRQARKQRLGIQLHRAHISGHGPGLPQAFGVERIVDAALQLLAAVGIGLAVTDKIKLSHLLLLNFPLPFLLLCVRIFFHFYVHPGLFESFHFFINFDAGVEDGDG